MKKQSFFKKSYLWMLAACIGLQATSCTNENDPAGGNESNMITFTVTPDYGVKTRAVSALPEGADALRYIMEVYDGTSLVADSRQVQSTTTPGTAIQFSLSKAPGKAYTVVFWADYTAADKADVYFDTTTGGLKDITLKKTLEPAEKCQAFSGTIAIDEKGEPAATSVSLKHAVAQVNLKTTNQLTGYGSVKVAYGEAEANAPASHFNALDGTATTNAVISGVTNTVDGTQTATESSPYTFHTYYVLAPKTTKSVINMVVDLCSDADGTTSTKQIKIASVPLQANYRTNITGGFGLEDNAFDVRCEDNWNTPDMEVYIFDGEGTEASPYHIKSVTEMKILAKHIDVERINYRGKYFCLDKDLDLNNEPWTPINLERYSNDDYGINFDGKGHKIIGLNVDGNYSNAGLFGYCKSIKNLHVQGSVNSTAESSNVGGIVGQIKIDGTDTPTIASNCSFEGSVKGYDVIGGLIGCTSGNYSRIEGCKNSATVQLRIGPPSTRAVGGLIGKASSIYVESCYNTGIITNDKGGDSSDATVGGLVGAGVSEDTPCGIHNCYNIGSITEYEKAAAVGSLTGDKGVSKANNCFVKEYYKNEKKEQTKIFANGTWPTWKAGGSADGTDENGYWKSVGSWDATNPVYPALWWE